MELDSKNSDPSIFKTPSIFIQEDNDFSLFCIQIKNITKSKNVSYKSSVNVLKLSISTIKSYKILITFLQSTDADFHIYRFKQEKPFRVVLRNLNHTTPLDDNKNELVSIGKTPINFNAIPNSHFRCFLFISNLTSTTKKCLNSISFAIPR